MSETRDSAGAAVRGGPQPLPDAARAALLGLLERYVPRDAAETEARVRLLRFVSQTPAPHDRATPEGHLTGSAYVLDGGALPTAPRVLLVHHHRLGRWLQLGGHAEGEWDPAETALREATEESGIDGLAFWASPIGGLVPPFDVDVHPIPARPGEPTHLHYDLRYLLVAPPGSVPRPPADEAPDVRWFDLQTAIDLADGSLRRALRALAAERASAADV